MKMPILIVSIFVVALTTSASSIWEISAHRGDRATYRENSISALIHAMDIGAHSVEFDVHLTKDSVPIIYHDYKLKPADFLGLAEPVLIKDLTLRQIQAIQYSERLVTPPHDRGLVTLKEFLSAVQKRESQGLPTIPLHLEIKSEKAFINDSAPIDELAIEISKVIDTTKIKAPIIARAFNWDVLVEFKRHQPAIPVILLVDQGDWQKIDFAKAIREFKPVGFAPNHSDLTPESVSFLVRQGIDVNPWTVNSPEVADKLVSMGVTGITTDNPQVFLERYKRILTLKSCVKLYK